MGDVERAAFTYQDGPIPGMLMLDGIATGQWHLRRQEGAVTAVLRVVRQLSGIEEEAVRFEADAMLHFSVPDAKVHSVEFTRYGRPG